jgi:hypothetical protein
MAKLKLDINTTPPPQSLIDAKSCQVRRYFLCLKLMTLPFLVSSLYTLASPDVVVPTATEQTRVYVEWMVFALTITSMFAWALVAGSLATTRSELQPLPRNGCGPVLAACEATEEGKAYREAVLAQGREFTRGEAYMLLNQAEAHQHALNCKAVYGIPAST